MPSLTPLALPLIGVDISAKLHPHPTQLHKQLNLSHGRERTWGRSLYKPWRWAFSNLESVIPWSKRGIRRLWVSRHSSLAAWDPLPCVQGQNRALRPQARILVAWAEGSAASSICSVLPRPHPPTSLHSGSSLSLPVTRRLLPVVVPLYDTLGPGAVPQASSSLCGPAAPSSCPWCQSHFPFPAFSLC